MTCRAILRVLLPLLSLLLLCTLLLGLFLHLLHRHVALIAGNGLFALRGQLRFPLSLASLCFFDAVGFVALDHIGAVRVLYVRGGSVENSKNRRAS